jgi:hypothetical protein
MRRNNAKGLIAMDTTNRIVETAIGVRDMAAELTALLDGAELSDELNAHAASALNQIGQALHDLADRVAAVGPDPLTGKERSAATAHLDSLTWLSRRTP